MVGLSYLRPMLLVINRLSLLAADGLTSGEHCHRPRRATSKGDGQEGLGEESADAILLASSFDAKFVHRRIRLQTTPTSRSKSYLFAASLYLPRFRRMEDSGPTEASLG